VSNTFQARKAEVVTAMRDASGAWAAAANVKFVYDPTQDATCSASNENVVFDVEPVNAGGRYAARAFFPDTDRAQRNVLIEGSAFNIPSPGTLTGILRHELGHTIGFRHEHTRPESGATQCFEDNEWRALTPYDSASVMHYPQCNGTNTFALTLTDKDKQGVALLYGAPGTTTPPPPPPPPPPPGTTATDSRANNNLAAGQTDAFGPYTAAPGTEFTVKMTGSGDADLYVRFGAAPTARDYACRPYGSTSRETCKVTVPANGSKAYVSVVGYKASSYKATITYTKP
jgi:hypothetical protein